MSKMHKITPRIEDVGYIIWQNVTKMLKNNMKKITKLLPFWLLTNCIIMSLLTSWSRTKKISALLISLGT